MTELEGLVLLIQSRDPIIAIESLEEERVETLLAEVASSFRVPLFVWTVTSGLRRHGSLNSVFDTLQPVKALGNAAGRCPATASICATRAEETAARSLMGGSPVS